MLKTSCHTCGSENTQRLYLYVQDRIQYYDTNTAGMAVGGGSGVFGSKSKGMRESEFAKENRPPRKRHILRPFLAWTFLAIACLFLYQDFNTIILFYVLAFFHMTFNLIYNLTDYKRLMMEYRQKFFCHRCGEIWEVE